ncbi:hypothetical protein E2562_018460 [Oryza meyeriana var. granulata]|uniref:Uncharacterized protein n=1 Tax=Oryza meyeriana var. granulata TaxID=110450 RepID=A0A6G1EMF3_9ORYZ|nr:hypothetical protein E2562_018460 [Oryza meyeriana var. granulata]
MTTQGKNRGEAQSSPSAVSSSGGRARPTAVCWCSSAAHDGGEMLKAPWETLFSLSIHLHRLT